MSSILLWTPSHGRAKAGRAKKGWPARTYLQKLSADTAYSPKDLPGAMDDRERVREIRSGSVL